MFLFSYEDRERASFFFRDPSEWEVSTSLKRRREREREKSGFSQAVRRQGVGKKNSILSSLFWLSSPSIPTQSRNSFPSLSFVCAYERSRKHAQRESESEREGIKKKTSWEKERDRDFKVKVRESEKTTTNDKHKENFWKQILINVHWISTSTSFLGGTKYRYTERKYSQLHRRWEKRTEEKCSKSSLGM